MPDTMFLARPSVDQCDFLLWFAMYDNVIKWMVFILAMLQVRWQSYWPKDCCIGLGSVTGPMWKHPFQDIFIN